MPWVFRDTRVRYLFKCMVYRFYTRISWIPPYTLKMYCSLQKMRTCLLTSFLPPSPPPSHLGSEFHLVPLPLLPPSPLSSAWFNFTGRAHQCMSGESNLFPRFFSLSDVFFRKKRKEKALAKDCSLPRRCSQGFVVPVRGSGTSDELLRTSYLDFEEFFQFAKVKSTRANHSYKLYCKLSRINCFKYSFFNNVISYWNNLPSNVVEAGSLELFKCKLKSFLKL